MTFNRYCTSVLVILMLSACGGGGGGNDGDNDGAGDGGDGGSTPVQVTSCQASFSTEKLADGQDCTPIAGTLCPQGNLILTRHEPIACDGVTVSSAVVTAAGLTSSYFALTGSETDYEAVYLSLHYLLADKGANANITRLPELAKGRKVLVIAPQAPILNSWPKNNLVDSVTVQPTIEWLQAVIADARNTFHVPDSVPLYVAGLSNGANMAYLFGCSVPEVTGILAVSGDANASFSDICTPNHQLGTVIVHGTNDLTTPYDGIPGIRMGIPEIHQTFETIDGCQNADDVIPMPNSFDSFQVTIAYTKRGDCADKYRNFLVIVDGGGHNWPGSERDINVGQIVFGAHTANFDATLQGYDLLRLAAGD